MNLKGPWKIVDSNKTQILLTAQKLFSEKGYRNTSIRDIADRVGTNCSMINYHFKTKENLYIQIIENLWPLLDYISSDTETDANVLLKDFVFKSIKEAFNNTQLIQLCLETKIFPVSEKADSIIKKMTEKHFSHFKILAEKAKYSHIKFLYTSIFALTIDIVSQNANSADSSKDSRDGLEDLLCYIETTFLVQ